MTTIHFNRSGTLDLSMRDDIYPGYTVDNRVTTLIVRKNQLPFLEGWVGDNSAIDELRVKGIVFQDEVPFDLRLAFPTITPLPA